MKPLLFLNLVLITILSTSCNQSSKKEAKSESDNYAAYTMYYNGDIITMEGESPLYVEAVVESNGEIVFVGDLKEAENQFKNAVKHDLKGATLLPAFLDGHGHVFNVGLVSMFANILSPPDGPGADISSVINSLNEFNKTEDGKWALNKFGWIVGNGYDDSQLKEKDHPNATDLDKVSTKHPVLIIHQSGHLGVINSKALEMMGWTSANTPDPKEGKLRRNEDGTPNGVMEENAFFTVLVKIFEKADAEVNTKAVKLGQEQYAQNGYLTAQEGRSTPDQVKALMTAAQNSEIYIDIVSYPDMRINGAYDLFDTDFYNADRSYNNGFKLGGVKLTLDGSPQGKTAWLTQHYHTPPAGKPADYKGFAIMSDSLANQYVEDAFKNRWQLLCHTNGDAAIDQYLTAIDKAQEKYNYDDHRTVIIHGQTIRKDQIERAASLNVDASLFPMHTYYWGDWHVESVLGHPRADYISPCVDAIAAGLNITSHHDAPVTFPNSMRVLDATVNRVTRSGVILGPDQRLSAYQGLKTLTSWAAHQYFEETTKGTLTKGKYADFVILNKNPIKIDPLHIHEIKILESIHRGNTVYRLENNKTVDQQITGGWKNIKINQEVKDAASFGILESNLDSKLKKIVSSKQQLVNGINYDLTFELENGEIWNGIVYKTRDGEYSIGKEFKRKK
ncbi:amidohydrolase family protein [Persicobacter diffluens]|uniref:Hydrolase n=1 Tax=Persicobacter diffluens TaxID=981 RepID=A0AAN4W4V0_9BACT|nr:hydrolase [Persicobacter diffluens]